MAAYGETTDSLIVPGVTSGLFHRCPNLERLKLVAYFTTLAKRFSVFLKAGPFYFSFNNVRIEPVSV